MSQNKEKFILKLDSSQLEQYLVCPLSWLYKYHESLRFKQDKKKIAANKGTLIHKMLDHFYKGLAKGESRYSAAKITQSTFIEENWAKELDLESETQFLKKRFFQYVTHYDERDFTIVKDKEGSAGTEVGFSKILYEDDKCIYIVEGRIDGITEISSGNAWVDHKTQGRAMLLYPFCPQFLTYSWATGLNWGIVNYIRMHEEYDPKKTFYKQIINFPLHLVRDWELKMLSIFQKIDLDLNYSTSIHKEGPTKEMILARFHSDKNESSCAGPFKSFPCQFCTLCEVDINDQKLYNIIKADQYKVVEKWSPWREEEESE